MLFILTVSLLQKNDAMWKRSVLTSLSKFAKPEATLATWCVSSHVREDLHNAGFEVQKVQGVWQKISDDGRHLSSEVFLTDVLKRFLTVKKIS